MKVNLGRSTWTKRSDEVTRIGTTGVRVFGSYEVKFGNSST